MMLSGFPLLLLIGGFAIGYLVLILEFYVKVNKTAVALLLAVFCWSVYFVNSSIPLADNLLVLESHLGEVAGVIFFLIGAMTVVELIDSHRGFKIIENYIQTSSKRQLLWIFSFLTFFLSAVLDNLASTIVVISLLRRVIPEQKERFLPSCMIIIAANAGGAWTPIGDITTTMLWIGGQITTWPIIKALFTPSLVSLLVPLIYFSIREKGRYTRVKDIEGKEEPGARLILFLGVASLVCVPIFTELTGLPPFVGILFGLGVLWLVTDLMHHKFEERRHLRVPFVLTKIDTASVLFFLGILLAMNALDSIGILSGLAGYLNRAVEGVFSLAIILGFVSAFLDNVPLVAALMGMYPITECPIDGRFWHLVAYAAGTGGSILLIGSAAGIAVMGMEKIDFFSYMKRTTIPVIFGFLAGLAAYLLFS